MPDPSTATTSPLANMSTSARNLLEKVRRLVPPMLEKFHKGQLGRVAVIGGSIDYTGAPYFSAMASAKLGCDMSHVICEPSAAAVIKSYSPNLMVHPLLHSTSSHPHPPHPNPHHHAEPIISFLPRIHALVIGPGLGRDPLTQSIVTEVMKAARTKNIPLVLDADALLLVQHQPELVRGYEECILTPNVVEFARLARAIGVDVSMQERAGGGGSGEEENGRRGEACERLARALGGVTIIQKGMHDVISNGATTVVSDVQGGKKRSGGQGDTLTGSLGTFLAWRKAYHEGLWEGSAEQRMAQSGKEIDAELHAEEDDDDASRTKERMSPKTTMLLVAWAGSAITRECSRRAFLAKGRSMQASDLTEEVHGAFLDLIGEPEGSKL